MTTTLLAPDSTGSYAGSVNNRGQVLFTADDGVYLQSAAGVAQKIDPPAGVDGIRPSGLTDRGDVVATSFFPPYKTYLRRDGAWRFVADGSAAGVNLRGQVLVEVDNADGFRGSLLLWTNGRTQQITARWPR